MEMQRRCLRARDAGAFEDICDLPVGLAAEDRRLEKPRLPFAAERDERVLRPDAEARWSGRATTRTSRAGHADASNASRSSRTPGAHSTVSRVAAGSRANRSA